ncbi:hypothetical protein LUU34_00490800 [Aix galericulata]|nr:hypothetical protein LUU34_00490800 [Aix galericulata]
MDGARRLGRMARLLSIVSIVLGTIIIVLYVSLSIRGVQSPSVWGPSLTQSHLPGAAGPLAALLGLTGTSALSRSNPKPEPRASGTSL